MALVVALGLVAILAAKLHSAEFELSITRQANERLLSIHNIIVQRRIGMENNPVKTEVLLTNSGLAIK